ncbi:MAG: J domain-containing protein [Anaerolineales bacterium]|nr:J domain-containing protein [Anaerolineales bacterium]
MDYRDYYKILGVSKSADEKEIKSAFRKLAQKYHPDKNPGDKAAEDKFKEINEAYEVLGDTQKRARYDQLGSSYSQWERSGKPGGGFDWGQWSQYAGGQGGTRVEYQDLNDILGRGGFSDFFNMMFGGARGFGGQGLARGEDVDQPIEITLAEAYAGATRTLTKGGRRLTGRIPRGARTGTKVRIKGEGGQGQPPGDLFLVVSVQPDERFTRDGDDLRVDVPVDLYTAVLGGDARVATLSGDVVLTIPPETQAGKTFRLAGRGMPKLRDPETHGDLLARIVVRVPTHLSEQERQLFRELAQLRKAGQDRP